MTEINNVLKKIEEMRDLLSQFSHDIREITDTQFKWVDKSYEVYGTNGPLGYAGGPIHIQNSDHDTVVEPGKTGHILFGVTQNDPTTKPLRGLPESANTLYGLEGTFKAERLIISDECASWFDVVNLWFGMKAAWRNGLVVPGNRFVEAAEPILFNHNTTERYLSVGVEVINRTNEPRQFKARIIGKERVV